jgi:ankyrin
VVRYLLDHGADVDAQANTKHSTPLHLASYYGGFKVAQLLLNHGVNVNVRDKMCRTPLHEALTNLDDTVPDYYVDAVRFLLDHGADVDAEDDNGSTPLHVISEHGNVKAARLLLEHGARVDAQDGDHLTPLHFASRYNNVEVAYLLVEHGANVNGLGKESLIAPHLLAMGSEDLDIDTILYGSS